MPVGSVVPGNHGVGAKKAKAVCLDVLRQPADTLTVTLSHDNTAHEDLDGTDALERDLALASGLVETKLVSLRILLASGSVGKQSHKTYELVLADGTGVCIKLVVCSVI